MTAIAEVQVKTRDNDFILTRVFDAPRALVFKAWTDPKHLVQWWGPKDFTNPVCRMDLRPGGAYRVTMRSPEGEDYPLHGVFLEILEPEKLVMTMDASDHPAEFHQLFNKFRGKEGPPMKLTMTVTFEEDGDKTKLTVVQRFDSTADRDANVKLGAVGGWTQSFERLDELLRKRK